MKNKNDLILTLQEKMRNKEFIIAAGVDTLSHARCCQSADCDLLLLYPTAKYQKAANRFLAGYLPIGNTNEWMIQTASEILPIIHDKNVLAGFNGSDPFKMDHILLKQAKKHHFTGIHNYPTMSLVDGNFGANIESLKLGLDKEISLLKKAKAEGFFTCAMIQKEKDGLLLAKADVDMIIIYLGLGEKGKQDSTFDRSRKAAKDILQLQKMTEAIRTIRPHLPLLFYDERITTTEEIKAIVQRVQQLNGYFLMPVTNPHVSGKQLELEIRQLKEIKCI